METVSVRFLSSRKRCRTSQLGCSLTSLENLVAARPPPTSIVSSKRSSGFEHCGAIAFLAVGIGRNSKQAQPVRLDLDLQRPVS